MVVGGLYRETQTPRSSNREERPQTEAINHERSRRVRANNISRRSKIQIGSRRDADGSVFKIPLPRWPWDDGYVRSRNSTDTVDGWRLIAHTSCWPFFSLVS